MTLPARFVAGCACANAILPGGLLLAACHGGTDLPDGAAPRDGGVARDAGSVRDAGAVCCPVQLDYSCYSLGGAMIDGYCERSCHCKPSTRQTEPDSWGCPRVVTTGAWDCDERLRDAGPPIDAALQDAAAHDAEPRDAGSGP